MRRAQNLAILGVNAWKGTLSSKNDADRTNKKQGDGVDLEDKPTELWAPAARSLFGDQPPPSRPPADASPPPTPADATPPPEEHDTEIMASLADTVEMGPEEASRAISDALREQVDTDEISGQVVARAVAGAGATDEGTTSGEYDAPDTVEMPAHAAAMAIAEAEDALLSDTVQVTGEEGEAAVRLAQEEREARRYDPNATIVVDRPRNLPKLSHECRMCGRRVSRPEPRRLRGPAHGEHGFRCEQCKNVFCAAHVVRVSGLWESLVSGGRFRCQLCLPQATGKG